MNICLISQEFPPQTNWGGIATYTWLLARRLAGLGHRVHVICKGVGEEGRVGEDSVVVHRIVNLPGSKWPYWLNNRYFKFQPVLFFSFMAAEKVMEIHQEESIDLVESPEGCAQAVVIALKHRRIPVVTRLHMPYFFIRKLNGIESTPEYRRMDFLERLQTRYSRGVLSPTRVMADLVRDEWKVSDTSVIPNFFDLDDYKPDPSVYNKYLAGKNYVLFFGRLEVRKGPHILSQAIPKILKSFPKLSFAFIGADLPYERSTMKQYILESHPECLDRLVFLDNIPQDQLYPVIEGSMLVVLPSLWENFPYSLLEAMSLGKAVIATRGSGFSEIIEDQVSGILVEPGCPDVLANAVLDLLSNGNHEQIGNMARQRALKFTSRAVVPRIIDYYDQIVKLSS